MPVIDVQCRIFDERLRHLTPGYATRGSAGMDLRACLQTPVRLLPGDQVTASAGLAIHLRAPGVVGIILPRSGLGSRGLVLGNTAGVIDSDYIGPLQLTLWNRGNEPFLVEPMMRVAQLLIVPVMQAVLHEVEDFDGTERGAGGFGSTGVA